MKNKKTRTGLWLLILLLLVVALMGAAVGKYSKKFEGKGNTVQFTVELAETMAIVESRTEQQSSGKYEYKIPEETVPNGELSYTLIPGLDIPKDPRIVITGKTQVPAYLYLTVENKHSAITFTPASCWKKVSEQSNVYVYCTVEGETKKPALLSGDNSTITIPILANNYIYVSQYLLTSTDSGGISFTAKLTEKAEH